MCAWSRGARGHGVGWGGRDRGHGGPTGRAHVLARLLHAKTASEVRRAAARYCPTPSSSTLPSPSVGPLAAAADRARLHRPRTEATPVPMAASRPTCRHRNGGGPLRRRDGPSVPTLPGPSRGRVSESRIRVTYPSHPSESRIRVTCPRHVSESHEENTGFQWFSDAR
jgi:hypothetical protein